MRNREKTLNIIFLSIIVILPFILYGRILFSGQMLFGTDWLGGANMKRQFVIDMMRNLKIFPLWTPNFCAGLPTGEGFLGDVFYPITFFLKLFLPLFVVWTLSFIIHPIIAGIGTYLFINSKTKSKYIAFFASLAYMFTGVILSETYAGHDGRIIVTCYLPLLIYFLDRGFFKEKLYYYGFAAISGTMMLLSGHVQSAYYAIVTGIYYISYLHINSDYKHKWRNYTWLIAIIIGFMFSYVNQYIGFVVFALGIVSLPIILDRKLNSKSVKIYLSLIFFILMICFLSAVQYLPLLRYVSETARGVSRGYQYAVSWSMGLSEIMDMFFPGFTGINFENINTYWGENPFKLHLRYIGIIPIFLALGAIFKRKKNQNNTFFTIMFFIGIIIALGGSTPIYRIFYNLFPYFDKFRAPDLVFFITSFAAIVLASEAIAEENNKKKMKIIGAIITLTGLTLILIPGIFEGLFKGFINSYVLNIQAKTMKMSNLSVALNAVKGTSFIIILLTILTYFGLFEINVKYKKYIIIALTIITVIGLWGRLNKYIIGVEKPSVYFAKDNVVKILEKDKTLFRVFPINYRNDNYLSLYNIQSIKANHPSPFADYQKFINNEGSVMFNPMGLIEHPNRLKYLNVKYLITSFIPEDTVGYDPKSKQAITQYNEMFNKMGFIRFENADKFMILIAKENVPRIFAVNKFIVENKLEKTLSLIDSEEIDPLKTVILNRNPSIAIEDDPLIYSISNLKYEPNEVSFDIELSSNAIVVLGDEYYKAWKCNIDNEKTEIMKANGIFRSINVEKGKHTIIFTYDSSLQIISLLISIFALLIIIVIFIFGKKNRFKKEK